MDTENRDNKALDYLSDQLCVKLKDYLGVSNVVLCSELNSMSMAMQISSKLMLDIIFMPCKAILDSCDHRKTIGSVSLHNLSFDENLNGVPQDYMYHQVDMARHVMASELKLSNHKNEITSHRYETGIIVFNTLSYSDAVAAVVSDLIQHGVKRLIIAAVTTNETVIRRLDLMVDEVIFIELLRKHALQRFDIPSLQPSSKS